MLKISDINSPLIRHYKSLRYTPAEHTEEGLFIAESEKIVLSLLKSQIEVISIFSTEDFLENNIELIENKGIADDSIYIAESKLMKEIVGFGVHTGVMAMARRPAESPMSEMSAPAVLLNNIVNAENVGSIIRNCAAFGFDTIVCDKSTVDPYLRRCVRVSMGNVFGMKVFHPETLFDTINILKSNGTTVICAENTPDAVPLDKFKFPEKSAMIFGSEGAGVDEELIGNCDFTVKIPISSQMSSINVAAASAIFMYSYSAAAKKL